MTLGRNATEAAQSRRAESSDHSAPFRVGSHHCVNRAPPPPPPPPPWGSRRRSRGDERSLVRGARTDLSRRRPLVGRRALVPDALCLRRLLVTPQTQSDPNHAPRRTSEDSMRLAGALFQTGSGFRVPPKKNATPTTFGAISHLIPPTAAPSRSTSSPSSLVPLEASAFSPHV